MRKVIAISAPSGAGKTSIVHFLLKSIDRLSFSVSACSRERRYNEIDGEDYHFLSVEQFKAKIRDNEFLEWEEVYPNQYYGTLKSEAERIWGEGKVIIFDVDVEGGVSIKKKYLKSIFIMPPSIEILKKRLQNRGSETTESLAKRLAKAKQEIIKSNEFDKVIWNHDLNLACEEAKELIKKYIE